MTGAGINFDDLYERAVQEAMRRLDPMPELCGHSYPSLCTAECETKNRMFDEWVRRKLNQSHRR